MLGYFCCLCTNGEIALYFLSQRCKRELEKISQSEEYISLLTVLEPGLLDFCSSLIQGELLNFLIFHHFLSHWQWKENLGAPVPKPLRGKYIPYFGRTFLIAFCIFGTGSEGQAPYWHTDSKKITQHEFGKQKGETSPVGTLTATKNCPSLPVSKMQEGIRKDHFGRSFLIPFWDRKWRAISQHGF